jgi:hypothetical protein
VITPQQVAPRQIAPPQQQANDGYIYPADGSSNEARYPAPRGYRRMYDAQGQQQYVAPQGYGAPQGYYVPQQGYPRPYYQQY